MFDEDRDIIEEVRSVKRRLKVLIVVLVIAALIFCILFTLFKLLPNREGPIDVVSEHNVMETIQKSDLTTVEYTYNSVVTQKDKKGKDDAYYVAYKGTIEAGIDLDKVDVKVDKENKKIMITLPDIKVDPHVEASSLDYIFKKKKYETEKIFSEALKSCEKDLNKESKRKDILEKATEESEESIRAMIEPWAEGYTVDFN
ncbi:MAG: DUF4230 domain-containing protein [Firmicutes bacterium]|nr:DUF4230 domain-containing protein [Bacillota bacterium]